MELKNAIIEIAYKAGEEIMAVYESGEINLDRKEDNSPLTEADKRAHRVIVKGLRDVDPGTPVLSEEGAESPYEERRSWKRYWLIDPLDGTKEFLKRNGEFTVNIALLEDNRPVMGVVYAPAKDLMVYAVKGEGAFIINENGNEENLRIKPLKEGEKVCIVASRSHLNPATKNFINNYETCSLISRGSSLKFLAVAMGEAHIYPRLAPTMEWDTAAAQIIVEEAGGEMVCYDEEMEFRYNKKNLKNPFFIVRCRHR